jgi:nitronate monooxygenase
VNRLCAVLGIERPILQSGMGSVAGPALAAAVSEAGGLGIIGALLHPPDAVRAAIREMRDRTDRPFGVNTWLHDELAPPTRPDHLEPALVERVCNVLDGIRVEHDLEPTGGDVGEIPDLLAASLEVMVDERIPVFSAGVGLPSAELVGRFHEAGTTVVTMVATVDDAVEAVARGADVIVAQGAEAGGHRSVGTKPGRDDATGLGTVVLVPAVRDAVGPDVAVAAAGGIVDGRGLAAAIALGADGVLMGSRFVATQESTASDTWKRALLDHDRPTVLTDALTGQWARTLRNDFVAGYDDADPGTLPSLLQVAAAGDIYAAAEQRADPELMPMYAGQGAVLLGDLPSVADVVRTVCADAERILARPVT